MTRPSRNDSLMAVAVVMATRSTCARLLVGAVISRDARIISTGYNGVPSGVQHCDHDCVCQWGQVSVDRPNHRDDCPADKPCTDTIHAEANAIVAAAKFGVATDGAIIHVTHSPCMVCARLIVNAGIVTVVYGEPYRDETPIRFLRALGVEVVAS